MADDLSAAADDATPLTALCGVCYVSAPKYRCPRCAARTCSLACVTKHKMRAGCSGARDPAAYMPASKLRTPAGIDHDYNFLSAIERARDRACRDVAGRTGIAPPVDAPDELPPDQNSSNPYNRRGGSRGHGRGSRGGSGSAAPGTREQQVRFRKIWRGDELVHIPIDPASWGRQRQQMEHMDDNCRANQEQQDDNSEDDDDEMPDAAAVAPPRQQPEPEQRIKWFPQALGKAERARCKDLDIEVVAAPTGMARQRENRTKWNKRTKGINWTIEWLVYDLVDKEEEHEDESDAGDSDTSSDTSSDISSESEAENATAARPRENKVNPRRLSTKPTRIVHTASDAEQLFRCFANTMQWVRRGKEKEEAAAAAEVAQQQKPQWIVGDAAGAEGDDDSSLNQMKKKRKRARLDARAGQQDPSTGGTWPASAYAAQNPFTGCWEAEDLGAATTCNGWEADEDLDHKRKRFRYYLLRPATGPPPRRLIPLGPDETLTEVLQGRTVLEFPTVYVIPVAGNGEPTLLPRGYAEASAGSRRLPKPPSQQQQQQPPLQEDSNVGGRGSNVGRRGGREPNSSGRSPITTGRGGSQQGNNHNNPRDRKRKPFEQQPRDQQQAMPIRPEKKSRVEKDDEGNAMEDGEVEGGAHTLAAVAAAAALDHAVDARVVKAALEKEASKLPSLGLGMNGLVAYDSDSE